MMPLRYYFLLIGSVFILQENFSQNKEIKSKADLPVLYFSTVSLHPGDSASVKAWMKNMAIKELPHIDSILRNYKISDIQLQISLPAARQFCNFIIGNWHDLTYADTLFKPIVAMPAYMRQSGLAEFASYAKVELQPSPNFNNDYISFLKQSLQSLSNEDKEKAIASLLGRASFFTRSVNEQINKLTAMPVLADTSLDAIGGYCYQQLNVKTRDLLLQYCNKMVLDKFSRADTLRGTIGAERSWWDVIRYDITVKPDLKQKTIIGKNNLEYRVISDGHPWMMQIDLQQPLLIDSIFLNATEKLSFTPDGNAWHVSVPEQKIGAVNNLLIY